MDYCFFKRNWRTFYKAKKNLKKSKNIENVKKEKIYKKILETFSDAELIDVKLIDGDND